MPAGQCMFSIPQLIWMETEMIVATFLNGQTDVYKGHREVKAAWQVIAADGKVYSGHSYDRAAAEKTARSYLTRGCGVFVLETRVVSPAYLKWAVEVAQKNGFKTTREYNADAKAKRAEYASRGKIEIVDL